LRLYDSDYFSASANARRIGPGGDYWAISEDDIGRGNIVGHAEIVSSFALEGKNVLEVGCATGALLKSLEKYEPRKLVGLDVSAFAVMHGIEHYGLDLRQGTIESSRLDAGEFDLVIMIDVIEHVWRLSSLIAETTRVLKDDGVILFRTPNADALKVAGRRWNFLHCGFEHVFYLSLSNLRTIGAIHGLIVQKAWSAGCPALLPEKLKVPTRLGRFVAQPWITATNFFYRRWLGQVDLKGLGLNLWGILQKEGKDRLGH
jgi:2-polyprenyl-3-methyl-5-hydroxy-6-metoxy-1,4-benzoquinol methylase